MTNRCHGDSNKDSPYYLLHCQWHGIKARCYNKVGRDYPKYGGIGVVVCDPWLDYSVFKEWAIENNWKKGLHFCRTGDIGNYEPTNVRLDTLENNTIEAVAKYYEFLSPNGMYICVYNLHKFCRINNLHTGHMSEVHSGKRKTHKSWTKY